MKSVSRVLFPLLLISVACICAFKESVTLTDIDDTLQRKSDSDQVIDSLIQNFIDSSEKSILELSSMNNEIKKLNITKDSLTNLISKYELNRIQTDTGINTVFNKLIFLNKENILKKDNLIITKIKEIIDSINFEFLDHRNKDSVNKNKIQLTVSQKYLTDLLTKLTNFNQDQILLDKDIYPFLISIKAKYRTYKKLTQNLIELKDEKLNVEDNIKVKEYIISNNEKLLKYILSPLYELYKENTLNGFHRFKFNGTYFRSYVVSSDEKNNVVRIHAAGQKGLKPLSYTWSSLKKKKPIFIMNAGMYNGDGTPVGLFINEGKVEKKLDITNQAISDNFHLYPNGVFFIDKNGKFNVSSTPEFALKYKEEDLTTLKYATQSGPMLLINGNYHNAFVFQSQNKNIRNGIGIIDQTDSNKMVMLISDSPVNFYNFSTIFKYIFNCKNALYMDGAISKMYFREDNVESGDLGGNLGPVITVSQK
jgi:uncharacterized protein YigE (DUF2233 family)